MIVAYACSCMCMCVNFEDEIIFRGGGGGGNVKPGKNRIFLKKDKIENCCYSTC